MTFNQPVDINVDKLIKHFETKEPILKELGVNYIILGGSAARKELHWWSDIDFFVSLQGFKNLDPDEKWGLLKKLLRIVGSGINHNDIDVSIIEDLPIKVKFSVFKEGILLYVENKERYNEDKGIIIRDFIDYKIWIDQYYKYQLEEVSK